MQTKSWVSTFHFTDHSSGDIINIQCENCRFEEQSVVSRGEGTNYQRPSKQEQTQIDFTAEW